MASDVDASRLAVALVAVLVNFRAVGEETLQHPNAVRSAVSSTRCGRCRSLSRSGCAEGSRQVPS
jgi:hypothetical protein